ncbi:serine hydrolase [Actinokineospora sp. UTMC 2448]|uniref:serine hydrolase domain-containing protein n=1 Tax=Actinokineospora sp. UTMC 2448 TaxID=2268449 RepID=UPI00216476F2|nr:serine hydrolase domain-containing protein [Actinokineospora sp. UTMC 2448]UVS78766.1 D-alanyl-D-alanine carboxypeptidase precursor [Actinokineospora sp. UTMC 2448]
MKRVMITAVAAVAALVVPAQAQAEDTHAGVQAVLDQYRSHAGPGAAVYAGDDTGAWQVSSGSATISATRPIAPTDHFRAASQTKTFIATVVAQLVDEGRVELDAPIERYLPGVVTGHYDGNAITVRQLLQHTSGIARDATNPRANADGSYSLAELVRAGLANPPQFAPGTGWGYSNVGYYVAAMLVERVTGQTFAAAIAERITTPLGLTATAFPAPTVRTLPSPFIPGYTGGRLGPFFFWYDTTGNMEMTAVGPAGAITSTQTDLAEFQSALAEGDLVSPATLAEMRETVPFPGSETVTYGLGLMRLTLSCGGQAWGHAGDLTTGHTSLTMVTDDGRFASLVTNTMVGNATAPTRFDVIDAALCEGSAA